MLSVNLLCVSPTYVSLYREHVEYIYRIYLEKKLFLFILSSLLKSRGFLPKKKQKQKQKRRSKLLKLIHVSQNGITVVYLGLNKAYRPVFMMIKDFRLFLKLIREISQFFRESVFNWTSFLDFKGKRVQLDELSIHISRKLIQLDALSLNNKKAMAF